MDIESSRARQGPRGVAAAPLDGVDDPEAEAVVAAYRDGDRRRRPRRPDRRLRADQARPPVRRARGRPEPRRRHQPDRPVQGLSLRHRRPPLLLQERRDQRDSGARSSATQFITRSRLSRIYYDRKFFHYPLKPARRPARSSARCESARILASYLKARLRPIRPERSFEDWVVNRFGRLLFEIFFKTYTEKVWGMPTTEISADWAAQRIKGLSLFKRRLERPVRRRSRGRGEVIKTLIDSFQYPRLGPGQMWEAARDQIRAAAGPSTSTAASSGSSTTARRSRRSSPVDASGRTTRYHGRALPLDPADPRPDPGA